MSDVENLIENAIGCLENNEDFVSFATTGYNGDMCAKTGIDISDVWDMAYHIFQNFKPEWEQKAVEEYREKIRGVVNEV